MLRATPIFGVLTYLWTVTWVNAVTCKLNPRHAHYRIPVRRISMHVRILICGTGDEHTPQTQRKESTGIRSASARTSHSRVCEGVDHQITVPAVGGV
jgi:hypothetical protein